MNKIAHVSAAGLLEDGFEKLSFLCF